jgi:hypothetical protein
MSEKENDLRKPFIDFILDHLVPDEKQSENASRDEVLTTS